MSCKHLFRTQNWIKAAFWVNMTVLVLMNSDFARAAGPNNIAGLSSRLESINCLGAYATTLADAEKRLEPQIEKECGSLEDFREMDACSIAAIKRLTTAVPGAIFTGNADAGQKTFRMSILSNEKFVFKSIREGFHGDGIDRNVSLLFQRPGLTDDEYTMMTSTLSQDGTAAELLIVPVKRRLKADLVYYFVNGCVLHWSR